MAADVIVIGAGHNGLVAACYLAKEGLDVTVVEASPRIGGCTTTAAMIPGAPEHLCNQGAVDIVLFRGSTVAEDLQLARYGYREVPTDPAHVYLSPDGESIAVWVGDPARTAEEIRRFSVRDARTYLDVARLLDRAVPFFFMNPVSPDPKVVLGALAHPRQMAKLGSLLRKTAAEVILELFEHPMTRALMVGPASLIGPVTMRGSGFNAMFVFFQQRFGASRVEGGTQGLPDSLARCLEAHGGTIRTASPVKRLLLSGGRVTGVELQDGGELQARAVLASCDPRQTLTELLPHGTLPRRLEARAQQIPTENMRMAFMKVDVAVAGKLEASGHAARRGDDINITGATLMGGSFEDVVAAVEASCAGRIPDPMPFYAVIPSAVDPTQAPAGQDCLYIWVGWMPMNPPTGWDALRDLAGQAVVASAGRYLTNLEELEVARSVETWQDISARTRMPWSNANHVDLTFDRSGPFRPARGLAGYEVRRVPGLFLTGAGTHPGPAVTGVPGQLAARTLARRLHGRGARS